MNKITKYILCIIILLFVFINNNFSSKLNIEERNAGCLFITKMKKGNIIYTEIFHPNCNLHDSGLLAKKCTEAIIKK